MPKLLLPHGLGERSSLCIRGIRRIRRPTQWWQAPAGAERRAPAKSTSPRRSMGGRANNAEVCGRLGASDGFCRGGKCVLARKKMPSVRRIARAASWAVVPAQVAAYSTSFATRPLANRAWSPAPARLAAIIPTCPVRSF